MQLDRRRNQDRIKAAAGVAAFHALLGYAFVTGLGHEVVQSVTEELKVFDVRETPPPPEEQPVPEEEKAPEPEGAAAPESIEAVAAPEPEIRLPVPPPVRTAPASGTGETPGLGSGSGGTGTGTGSGGSGSGTGGGGGGGGAQRIRGMLSYGDLPHSARLRGARGWVGVRFVVEPSGRATGCTVTRPSGDADLDGTTCRMIERRFRYRPARDASGNPVAETITTGFEWTPTGR